MLLSDGTGLKHIVGKLPLAVCGVEDQEGQKEHSLVPALQVLQELFRLRPVSGKVGGNYIHVIAAADRFLLFLDFCPVQVGNLALDGLDGAHLVHRLDVQVHDQAAFHVQEVRQHPVIQLRREDLDEGDSPELFPHAEGLAVGEGERAGRNKVFGGEAGRGQPVPGELKRFLSVHVENLMQHPQALLAI